MLDATVDRQAWSVSKADSLLPGLSGKLLLKVSYSISQLSRLVFLSLELLCVKYLTLLLLASKSVLLMTRVSLLWIAWICLSLSLTGGLLCLLQLLGQLCHVCLKLLFLGVQLIQRLEVVLSVGLQLLDETLSLCQPSVCRRLLLACRLVVASEAV